MFGFLPRWWVVSWLWMLVWSTAGCSEEGPITLAAQNDAVAGGDMSTPKDALVPLSDGAETVGDVFTDGSDTGLVQDAEVSDVVPEDSAPRMPPGAWRSKLYPVDWTPQTEDLQGRFLHDFSYAGYKNGEESPEVFAGAPIFDVMLDFQATPGGQDDCTEAVQAAIDAASEAGGGVVYFPGGLYRIDGTLKVESSGVVLRGAGPDLSRIFFSGAEVSNYSGHLMFSGALNTTHEVALVMDAPSRQAWVEVESADGFQVGDDVQIGWIVSPDFVEEHEMEYVWNVFNDTWQPFFHRNVVAVDAQSDPPRLTLDVPLRYRGKTRDGASVRRIEGYLHGVGVEDLGMADATDWETAWAHTQVHLFRMVGVKDSWVKNLWSFKPPTAPDSGLGKDAHLQNSGLMVKMSKRVTVADSRLSFAQNRGSGGCGYLFEVRQSSEILFRDCLGRAGRHNFIQNWGFGATGIVWLRVHSLEGENIFSKNLDLGLPTTPDFHHSLAAPEGQGWPHSRYGCALYRFDPLPAR